MSATLSALQTRTEVIVNDPQLDSPNIEELLLECEEATDKIRIDNLQDFMEHPLFVTVQELSALLETSADRFDHPNGGDFLSAVCLSSSLPSGSSCHGVKASGISPGTSRPAIGKL